MSYILEALRKSEGERGTGEVPTLAAQHDFPSETGPEATRSPWPWLLSGLLAVNVAVLAAVFWPRLTVSSGARETLAENPPATAQTRAPATETVTTAPESPTSARGAEPASAQAGVTNPPAASAIPNRETYPQPAYGQQGGYAVNAYPPSGYPQQAYPQQAYPQQAYPQQAYPQQAYPQPAYGQQPYPNGAYAQPPAYPGNAQPAPGYAQPSYPPQGGYPVYPQQPGYGVAPGYAQAPTYAAPAGYGQNPMSGSAYGASPSPAQETLPALDDGETLVTPNGIRRQDANSVPTLEEMPPAFRSQIPAIELSTHVYSTNPAKSFVVINGQTFGPGNAIFPGITLAAVIEDGVVLEYQGQRFRIDAIKAWTGEPAN